MFGYIKNLKDLKVSAVRVASKRGRAAGCETLGQLHEYLAYKKPHHPRILQ